MKRNFSFKHLIMLVITALFVSSASSQAVGINTDSPLPGAALDIAGEDKGFLMTRVELTGTDDTTTITPAATTGLIVYNTVTAGVLPFQVTPGFYYWDSAQWRRLYNQGYTLRYKQGADVRADNSSSVYVNIPNLDTGTINVPFSGTYQIVVSAYYCAGTMTGSGTRDGAGIASVQLQMDTNASGSFTTLEERFITSSTKTSMGNTFYHMPQQTTMIYTVELDVMNTYRFRMRGREWTKRRANRGFFGRDSDNYTGNSGSEASRGTMTITLIEML